MLRFPCLKLFLLRPNNRPVLTTGKSTRTIQVKQNPTPSNHRTTHNVNVQASYNVMRTAADLGIKKIVSTSSVNAVGLLYTDDSRRVFDELPLTEESPRRPEDPYSQSRVSITIADPNHGVFVF
jgi:hypothetical protein